jgi:hypothetical protein
MIKIMNKDADDQKHKFNSVFLKKRPNEIEINEVKRLDENSEDENSKILNIENNDLIESPVLQN